MRLWCVSTLSRSILHCHLMIWVAAATVAMIFCRVRDLHKNNDIRILASGPNVCFTWRDNDKMFTFHSLYWTKSLLSECLRSSPPSLNCDGALTLSLLLSLCYSLSLFLFRLSHFLYCLCILLAIEMCYQQYNASNDPSDRVQAIL